MKQIRIPRGAAWWRGLALAAGLLIIATTAAPAAATVTRFRIESGRTFNANVQFFSMSCPTTTFCAVVGSVGPNVSKTRTYAETWNGTTWSMARGSAADGSALGGVSCVAPDWCQAVGVSANFTAVRTEHWDGHAWSQTPSPGRRSGLAAVSCTSRTWCVAVGNQPDGETVVPLVERWNGTTWKKVASPSQGTNGSALGGVSCVSPNWCMAVGSYSEPGFSSSRTLIERWDGHAWRIVPSDDPARANQVVGLWGVDCASPTMCMAVGRAESGALIERWNGKTWKLVAHPNGKTPYAVLTTVSCVSGNACVAVGSGPNGGMAEAWNGTTWSKVLLPPPGSRRSFAMWAVSCATATFCKATGPNSTIETSS